MRRSKQKQIDARSAVLSFTVAKTLAPEDIQLGDFVTILYAIAELPSYLWCADAATLPLHEPIRFQFVPAKAGIPLKVKSICLPFVLAKHPCGKRRTVDVRLFRLARLDKRHASVTWKAYRESMSKRKRK